MESKAPASTDASFPRAVLEALHADDEFPPPDHPDLPDPPVEPEDPEHAARKWEAVARAIHGWSA